MPVQYINDENGEPIFVVIPYAEYTRQNSQSLQTGEESVSQSLLSEDGLFIRLPHGGPDARIDLQQFVDAWMRRGTISMLAVSQRRQSYDRFEGEALNGLDAILRRCFLPVESPYRNTMQATTAVVDALVETGIYSRCVESMPGYYRPVQCIRIDVEKAAQFLEKHGRPENPLDIHQFVLP